MGSIFDVIHIPDIQAGILLNIFLLGCLVITVVNGLRTDDEEDTPDV